MVALQVAGIVKSKIYLNQPTNELNKPFVDWLTDIFPRVNRSDPITCGLGLAKFFVGTGVLRFTDVQELPSLSTVACSIFAIPAIMNNLHTATSKM